jgi:hypothetical protein
MDDHERSTTLDDDTSHEARPRRFETVADMWFSDNPPWDPEVLENIDELAWRLSELRAMGDRGDLLGWARLR